MSEKNQNSNVKWLVIATLASIVLACLLLSQSVTDHDDTSPNTVPNNTVAVDNMESSASNNSNTLDTNAVDSATDISVKHNAIAGAWEFETYYDKNATISIPQTGNIRYLDWGLVEEPKTYHEPKFGNSYGFTFYEDYLDPELVPGDILVVSNISDVLPIQRILVESKKELNIGAVPSATWTVSGYIVDENNQLVDQLDTTMTEICIKEGTGTYLEMSDDGTMITRYGGKTTPVHTGTWTEDAPNMYTFEYDDSRMRAETVQLDGDHLYIQSPYEGRVSGVQIFRRYTGTDADRVRHTGNEPPWLTS